MENDPPSAGGAGGEAGAVPVVSSSSSGGGASVPATSCEDAPLMVQNSLGYWVMDDVITPKSGSAFVRFELDRTGWLIAFTEKQGDSDLAMMLRSPEGELLATVDDSPRKSMGYAEDVQISYFFEEQGVYCLEVKPFAAFTGEDAPSVGPFQVSIVDPLDFEFVNLDAGGNDTIGTAQPMTTDGILLGSFEAPGDVDVYRLSLPQTAMHGIVAFDPGGIGAPTWFEGSGAPAQGSITVLASDGTTILARARPADLSASCVGLALCELVFEPRGETDIFVVFEGPETAPLAPATYYAAAGWTTYLIEHEPAGDETSSTNDTPSGATYMKQYRAAGHLHEGDVDWWRIGDADDPTVIGVRLVCSARSEGGGLLDLEVEVYSADSNGQGDPIASFVETATERLNFSHAPIAQRPPLPGGAEYLLRVSAGGLDPEVDHRAYGCDVLLDVGSQ